MNTIKTSSVNQLKPVLLTGNLIHKWKTSKAIYTEQKEGSQIIQLFLNSVFTTGGAYVNNQTW